MKTLSLAMRFILLLPIILIAHPSLLGAQDVQLYRTSTETNSRILDLSRDGLLSWSNDASQGDFLIERSYELDTWRPIARDAFSNQLWAVKVFEPDPPAGFAFIPGGRFLMGDSTGDVPGNTALPVREVTLSSFFMKIFEVTNQELRDVFQWAYDQGLVVVTNNEVIGVGATNVLLELGNFAQEVSFEAGTFSVQAGRTNHPCAFVTWYGTLAYCNYLGSMEGREPCYDLTDWTCDFSKNGYRLPTEAQWEYAARGGFEGLRFGWSWGKALGVGDVISYLWCNYKSDTNYYYDISPTSGYNPLFGDTWPKSTPVGIYPPNNYGLYDMAGNIFEWVWDWSARYNSSSQPDDLHDPTGPETGTFKPHRGGSWYTTPERVLVAFRYTAGRPDHAVQDVGFRTMLPYQP